MSPLPTSSTTPLHDDTLSLPLRARSNYHVVTARTADSHPSHSRILDIAVASGIVALLIALLIPALNNYEVTLASATRGLVDHLRLARAGAASHGTHFRVTLHPQTYAIEQLQDQDGNGIWERDSQHPTWQVTLPPTVAINAGAGMTIEFDARGLMVTASSDATGNPVVLTLIDSHTEKSETIEILSSGKVQRS